MRGKPLTDAEYSALRDRLVRGHYSLHDIDRMCDDRSYWMERAAAGERLADLCVRPIPGGVASTSPYSASEVRAGHVADAAGEIQYARAEREGRQG